MLNNYHTGHDQSNCSGVEYFFLLINGQKKGFIKDLRRYLEERYKLDTGKAEGRRSAATVMLSYEFLQS